MPKFSAIHTSFRAKRILTAILKSASTKPTMHMRWIIQMPSFFSSIISMDDFHLLLEKPYMTGRDIITAKHWQHSFFVAITFHRVQWCPDGEDEVISSASLKAAANFSGVRHGLIGSNSHSLGVFQSHLIHSSTWVRKSSKAMSIVPLKILSIVGGDHDLLIYS